MVSHAKDFMCDTLLPIKTSADEWKTAQPLTKTTKQPYPFGTARPTSEEVCMLVTAIVVMLLWFFVSLQLGAVYNSAVSMTMNTKNSADLDAYIAQVLLSQL